MRPGVTAALSILLAACTPPPPSTPAARVATQATVTRENPAGDAIEPEDAAATRLLDAKASERPDRALTLGVHLADAPNWKRVRIFGHPTRATHRYGDAHYAVDSVEYRAAQGEDTPEACLQEFVERARTEAQKLGVVFGPIVHGHGQHPRGVESLDREGPRPPAPPPPAGAPAASLRPLGPRGAPLGYASMPHVRGSGELTTFFRRSRYVGAVAAYQSWPGTCLIHAFAVKVGTDEALAVKVVDRWVDELAPRTRWSVRLRKAPRFEDR